VIFLFYFSELLTEDFSTQHKTSHTKIACVAYDSGCIYPVKLTGIFSGNLYSGWWIRWSLGAATSHQWNINCIVIHNNSVCSGLYI